MIQLCLKKFKATTLCKLLLRHKCIYFVINVYATIHIDMDVEDLAGEEHGLDENQINNAAISFNVCLTLCNVNKTSHGVVSHKIRITYYLL